jgi:hypothetical protein
MPKPYQAASKFGDSPKPITVQRFASIFSGLSGLVASGLVDLWTADLYPALQAKIATLNPTYQPVLTDVAVLLNDVITAL